MSSLALCLKKAGKALSGYEKEQLRAHVAEGMTEAEAVQLAIEEVMAEREAIIRQLPLGEAPKVAATGRGEGEKKKRVIPGTTPETARDFRSWVRLTGGVNPNDPTLRGEIKDMIWKDAVVTINGKPRRQKVLGKGFGHGFLSHKARFSDVRTKEAIEAGWLAPGSDENDFIAALESDLKVRWADQGDQLDK